MSKLQGSPLQELQYQLKNQPQSLKIPIQLLQKGKKKSLICEFSKDIEF